MNLSNNKKIIGFDMDGVILDHSVQKVRLSEKFGYKLDLLETPSYVMHEKIEDKNVYREIQSILYDDPIEAFKSPLMNGSFDTLSFIKNSGKTFYLISRRKKHDVAKNILMHHKLWPTFFNDKNTFFVSEPIDKEIVAKRLGITDYIDDEEKILDVLDSVKNKFLFDQFGIKEGQMSKYKTLNNWEDVLTVLS